ncbi:MAG: dUTP diphosphatase [Bacteroidota bacterium]
MIEVPVEKMPEADDLPLPSYATPGSAGLDLLAAVGGPTVIAPGGVSLVPTGIRLALPSGFEGQVRPRSGLAQKFGLTVLNAPGTIDSDYRGEVKVLLINLGPAPVTIERGQRIAQLVVARVERIRWTEGAGLPESRRGSGGFGHTGI